MTIYFCVTKIKNIMYKFQEYDSALFSHSVTFEGLYLDGHIKRGFGPIKNVYSALVIEMLVLSSEGERSCIFLPRSIDVGTYFYNPIFPCLLNCLIITFWA